MGAGRQTSEPLEESFPLGCTQLALETAFPGMVEKKYGTTYLGLFSSIRASMEHLVRVFSVFDEVFLTL